MDSRILFRQRNVESVIVVLALLLLLAWPSSGKLPETFELVAAGDVMLSRGVGKRIAQYGVHYPFQEIRDLLMEADLSFVNLECVLSSEGEPMPRKEFTFRAIPEAVLGLQAAGIDVVSVSNNHSMDYGAEALLDMNDILAHHRIAFAGAGRNAKSAHREALIRLGTLTVAVLAYSENFYLTVEATETQPGIAVISEQALMTDIRRAKSRADIVIVSFHWGWEYSDHPTEKDRQRAHLSIDSGADLVIGHHPHVIQGIERYKHGLICYSLGNFIFDQRKPATQRGLLFRGQFSAQGIQKAELIPTTIHPLEFRPRRATGKEAGVILTELMQLSQALDTPLQRTSDDTVLMIFQRTKHPIALSRQPSEGVGNPPGLSQPESGK